MTAASTGREQLLAAAEALYAERGIDGASLREVGVAAGARNASAVQYHFGDRAGLLRAILAKHRPAVEARRHALLDAYDERGTPDAAVAEAGTDADDGGRVGRDALGQLAHALVVPLADELAVPGGPGYLQVLSDLANRPRPAVDPASLEDPTDSTYRWRAAVEPLLSVEAVGRHRRFVAVRFTLAELARRTRDRRAPDDRLFTADLVDLVAGVLAAPVSEVTRAEARARRTARP